LIAPVRPYLHDNDMMVVVGDRALHQLPFASLVQPWTDRYLIEDFNLVLAPSANVFLASMARSRPAPQVSGRALIVGNPAFDRRLYAQLRDLPGAEREADRLSHIYPDAVVLTRAAATRRRFLTELPHADMVHIAGHAIVNDEYPMHSELVFAGSSEDDSSPGLQMGALREVHLAQPRLVVLGACDTAGGWNSRLEGAMSFARAFLSMGVPTVVATQWDVDDADAERVFGVFHEHWSRGVPAAEALRKAQLAMARGPDNRLTAPRHWAGYAVFGAGR
jgi:CHAT domain-containing protein